MQVDLYKEQVALSDGTAPGHKAFIVGYCNGQGGRAQLEVYFGDVLVVSQGYWLNTTGDSPKKRDADLCKNKMRVRSDARIFLSGNVPNHFKDLGFTFDDIRIDR